MEIRLNYIAFFFLISGTLLWVIAYISMIRQAFKDKAIAYPLVGNMVNWSWELIYSGIQPVTFVPSLISNVVWLLLNSIILFTFFKFTKRNKLRAIGEALLIFCLMFLLIRLVNYRVEMGFLKNFNTLVVLGFVAALVFGLSLLYLVKVVKTIKGQSVLIAKCTFLGTFCYVMEIVINPAHKHIQNPYNTFLMISSLVILLIYCVELIKTKKRESLI